MRLEQEPAGLLAVLRLPDLETMVGRIDKHDRASILRGHRSIMERGVHGEVRARLNHSGREVVDAVSRGAADGDGPKNVPHPHVMAAAGHRESPRDAVPDPYIMDAAAQCDGVSGGNAPYDPHIMGATVDGERAAGSCTEFDLHIVGTGDHDGPRDGEIRVTAGGRDPALEDVEFRPPRQATSGGRTGG